MGLTKKDRDFRYPRITYLEYKQIEMDRVLTMLFPRLKWDGALTRFYRKKELQIEDFVKDLISDAHVKIVPGFKENPDIVKRWVETHLMDVVNRGTADQAVAAPRPLHGETYLLRNPKRCRDYGASQHIYETLYSAPGGIGTLALKDLQHFFFSENDYSGSSPNNSRTDVETTALLLLREKETSDVPDKTPREICEPFLPGASKLLAEDIAKLFAYKNFVPRTVMVEYIKILLCFHLALYHIKLMKVLPQVIADRNGLHNLEALCYGDVDYSAHWRLGILVDVANERGTLMANLAERSAQTHFGRIPPYIKAHYTIKKLAEFADRAPGSPARNADTIRNLLELLGDKYKNQRDQFFGNRVHAIFDVDSDEALPDDIMAIKKLELDMFNTYIECIYSDRIKVHQANLITCLDSLFMKHRPGAMLTQARTRGAPRKFIIDTQLIEVLVQLAVLEVDPFKTREIQVDELLSFLRTRYGLYIDRMPDTDGFEETPTIEQLRALRHNQDAFKERLREIGFYSALSDAYVTQLVVPRYKITRND